MIMDKKNYVIQEDHEACKVVLRIASQKTFLKFFLMTLAFLFLAIFFRATLCGGHSGFATLDQCSSYFTALVFFVVLTTLYINELFFISKGQEVLEVFLKEGVLFFYRDSTLFRFFKLRLFFDGNPFLYVQKNDKPCPHLFERGVRLVSYGGEKPFFIDSGFYCEGFGASLSESEVLELQEYFSLFSASDFGCFEGEVVGRSPSQLMKDWSEAMVNSSSDALIQYSLRGEIVGVFRSRFRFYTDFLFSVYYNWAKFIGFWIDSEYTSMAVLWLLYGNKLIFLAYLIRYGLFGPIGEGNDGRVFCLLLVLSVFFFLGGYLYFSYVYKERYLSVLARTEKFRKKHPGWLFKVIGVLYLIGTIALLSWGYNYLDLNFILGK